MRNLEGRHVIGDARFCVVAARFNESVVSRLLEGALDALKRHGAEDSQVHVLRVPGAFELPLAAMQHQMT